MEVNKCSYNDILKLAGLFIQLQIEGFACINNTSVLLQLLVNYLLESIIYCKVFEVKKFWSFHRMIILASANFPSAIIGTW